MSSDELNKYIYYTDLQDAENTDMLYHADRTFVKLR